MINAGLVGLVVLVIGALIAIVAAAMQVKPDSCAAATTVFYTVEVPYTPATTTPSYTAPIVHANAPAPLGHRTAQRGGVDIARRALQWIQLALQLPAPATRKARPTACRSMPMHATTATSASFDCSGLVIYAMASLA